MSNDKTRPSRRTESEYKAIGKMIEDLYLVNAKNPGKILWFSFLRGLAYGLGIFLGGTIIVALVLWFLGLFDQVPLIGPLVQHIVNSLQ